MRSTTVLVGGGMEDSKVTRTPSLPSLGIPETCSHKLPLTFYHSFKTVTHQTAGHFLWVLHSDGGDGDAEWPLFLHHNPLLTAVEPLAAP